MSESGKFMFDPRRAPASREARELQEAPELGPVPVWSFSMISHFEECPYRVALMKIDKVEQVQSSAGSRGDAIHKAAERYIRGEDDELEVVWPDNVPQSKQKVPGFDVYADELDRLRSLYADGAVEVEQNWGFTRQWTTTDFFGSNVWGRMKLDVLIHEDETSAEIIDWKSGKKFGNEFKHGSQAIFYAVGAFRRYPALEFVKSRFIYVDQGEELEKSFPRPRAELLGQRAEARALALTTAKHFPPKPQVGRCKYCPVSEHCEYSLAPGHVAGKDGVKGNG